jgi:hypothetical protein
MIESIMYFGLGFCAAGLSVVLLVPLVHGRAVRLTTRRLEAALPSSAAEIAAAKDIQRAEFALATRRLETKLDEFKTKDANHRAELGRKTDSVNRLRLEIEGLYEELRRTEQNRVAQANEVRQLQRVVSENESTSVETRSALRAISEQLVEERTKFASFQDRIAAGVRQAAAKSLPRSNSAPPTTRPRSGLKEAAVHCKNFPLSSAVAAIAVAVIAVLRSYMIIGRLLIVSGLLCANTRCLRY